MQATAAIASTVTLGFMFKCRCGIAKRRDYEAALRIVTRMAGRAPFLRQVRTTESYFTASQRRPEADAQCECGRTAKYTEIAGRVTDHVCGSKCLLSKGHVCDCACGGANHGRGHG